MRYFSFELKRPDVKFRWRWKFNLKIFFLEPFTKRLYTVLKMYLKSAISLFHFKNSDLARESELFCSKVTSSGKHLRQFFCIWLSSTLTNTCIYMHNLNPKADGKCQRNLRVVVGTINRCQHNKKCLLLFLWQNLEFRKCWVNFKSSRFQITCSSVRRILTWAEHSLGGHFSTLNIVNKCLN